MAGIIRTLFKSKKSKKEESENNEDLAREVSNRRSFRAPSTSSSKSQRRAVARFADDGALSATAAYHTTGAPKLRKGPQSCPGGYRDESDVSYESDKYSQKSNNGHRRREVLHQSMRHNYTIDEGRKANGSGRRNKGDFRRRGESSEYGSGDPSPVGQYSSRRSHYEDTLDESENEDFSEKDQFAVMERAQYHYMNKYKDSEQRRREDKRKFKEALSKLENECNKEKNSVFHYMSQVDSMKKERDHYKNKYNRVKKQLEMLQNNASGFDAFHNLRPPQLANPQQFPPALSMGAYNYIGQSMNSSHHTPSNFMSGVPPSSNTPMTMTSGGAGESLTNPSDVSFLQNSFLRPTSQGLSGLSSPVFKVPTNFGDEDTDEVKDYREELMIETARCSKRNTDLCISPSSSADSQVTLLDQSTNNKEDKKPPSRPFSMMSI